MPSITNPDFEDRRERPGFACRRARVGRQAGALRLGASLWELPPGEAAYPYHFHLGEEELIVVLTGRPSLRSPGGWRELEEGEVVSFGVGEEGAHQLANRSEQDVRFLSISANAAPEICIYPDSGKLGVFGHPIEDSLYELYRRGESVDYWEGEEPPG